MCAIKGGSIINRAWGKSDKSNFGDLGEGEGVALNYMGGDSVSNEVVVLMY